MKREVESIRKTMWGVYWRLYDKRKRPMARLRGYLDGLSPETRHRIVLGVLAALVVFALYVSGEVVYGIGRNDGLCMEAGHAGRVELPAPVETDNHLVPYLYGTDEE